MYPEKSWKAEIYVKVLIPSNPIVLTCIFPVFSSRCRYMTISAYLYFFVCAIGIIFMYPKTCFSLSILWLLSYVTNTIIKLDFLMGSKFCFNGSNILYLMNLIFFPLKQSYLGWPQTWDPPSSASPVAGITGHHHNQLESSFFAHLGYSVFKVVYIYI